MAKIEVEYFSNALVRPITIRVVIPYDPRLDIPQVENPYLRRPMKTIFNLPGYTGGAGWGDEQIAAQYNTAIVSVYGENAFYVDNAAPSGKYAKFIGEEVVEACEEPGGHLYHGHFHGRIWCASHGACESGNFREDGGPVCSADHPRYRAHETG